MMIKKQEELRETANLIAAKGKGLLAVDESTPTIGKRLAGINIETQKRIGRLIGACFLMQKGLVIS